MKVRSTPTGNPRLSRGKGVRHRAHCEPLRRWLCVGSHPGENLYRAGGHPHPARYAGEVATKTAVLRLYLAQRAVYRCSSTSPTDSVKDRLTPDLVEFETALSILVRWANGEKNPALDRLFLDRQKALVLERKKIDGESFGDGA